MCNNNSVQYRYTYSSFYYYYYYLLLIKLSYCVVLYVFPKVINVQLLQSGARNLSHSNSKPFLATVWGPSESARRSRSAIIYKRNS